MACAIERGVWRLRLGIDSVALASMWSLGCRIPYSGEQQFLESGVTGNQGSKVLRDCLFVFRCHREKPYGCLYCILNCIEISGLGSIFSDSAPADNETLQDLTSMIIDARPSIQNDLLH